MSIFNNLTKPYLVFLIIFLSACVSSSSDSLNSEAVGLRAIYYDNEDFTGTQVRRVDAALNFNWGEGSPVPGIAPDTFSVRWIGSITPRYSELYTFTANADDGLRIWVNGVKLIDDWGYTPNTRYAKLKL